MSGSELNLIKKRIKSIKNIKKITNAMGMVASSKVKKIEKYIESNNKFNEYMEEIMKDMMEISNQGYYEGIKRYVFGNGVRNKLYIIITSDMGLCGSYNSSILNFTIYKLKELKEAPSIITLGEKGKIFFNRFRYTTVAEYVDVPDIPTIEEAKTISEMCKKLFDEGKIGEIYVIYSKYLSVIKREVVLKKILPINNDDYKDIKDIEDIKDIKNNKNNKDSEDNEGNKNNRHDKDNKYNKEEEKGKNDSIRIIYDNDLDDKAGDYIINAYLEQKLLNFMINAKASEQSSRMEAMESGTKNANDLLYELKKRYNRIRQNTITQEIEEIIGGAEVQS
ncbi:ATP synthase gamma chain precursor [Clostridium tepidiprofundi DSM 19306]|uniref:ATP synthase gamma chain n=1 Tax=Clostridium tepidiprofundi DSM 19306 TaxID=1121338 RepID=A0A151B532_9CLOT|nr:ATP synthase F1 subunit gamma [Clostridium tepidiprofundi]KYH34910.1 ATP synthase gamma chain precursor [Clostridium tepidiprofundi DSM 19306]